MPVLARICIAPAILLLGSCAKPEPNLLETLDQAKIRASQAHIYLDPVGHSLTLTFRYTQGEPEVRIPVADMNWPTDWSAYRSLQYTFLATSLETVSIGFSDGESEKFFVTEPLPGIRIYGVIPFDAFVQTGTMTPLRPLGYKVWPNRLFTFERVKELIVKMRYPSQDSQFTIYNLTLREDVPEDDILDRKPLIDRFGQWVPENWKNKARSEEQLQALWDQDQLQPQDYGYCPAGGDPSRQFEATGFFRTARVQEKWVLIDPHGHPFFSTGMNLVAAEAGSFATDVLRREFLFEELPLPGPPWLEPDTNVSFYIANLMKRHGSSWKQSWNTHIVERLQNWGFNTIANWSDRDVAVSSGMPYVLPLQGWTTGKTFPFPYDFPDVFSEEFKQNVDRAAREQVEALKEDPNLIGWFLGNEPRWARNFGALQTWPDMVLADPEPSATRAWLENLIAANPAGEEEIRKQFLFTCGEKYFRTIVEAVRRHDPNHLILGIRFAGHPDERWAELSRMFDVFSINIYSASLRPETDMVRRYAEISGKPVLIGEFTAGTPGRGLQGLFYNVHKVKDYAERGKAYRYYVENAAADPFIIGTHWFQLVDDLPTGRPSDEERLNYGFLNVIDLPYPDLVEAAQTVYRRLYDLKFENVQPYSQVPDYN
jgi:hypothetical protein